MISEILGSMRAFSSGSPPYRPTSCIAWLNRSRKVSVLRHRVIGEFQGR